MSHVDAIHSNGTVVRYVGSQPAYHGLHFWVVAVLVDQVRIVAVDGSVTLRCGTGSIRPLA